MLETRSFQVSILPGVDSRFESINISKEHPHCFCTLSDIVMLHTGSGEVRYRTGPKSHHYAQHPGNILISPRNYEYTSGGVLGDPHRIVVELSGPILDRLFDPESRRPSDMQLAYHDGIQDPIIGSLISIMTAEIEAGCPSGKIYAESTSLAFLVYLTSRYSVPRRSQPDSTRRLSQRDLQNVIDWIYVHLDSDIGLPGLGGLVKRSPYEFCRLFKNAVGVSPHQFIMRERIEKAKRLLRERRGSIVEVSLMLGFSSQSHFTSTFRRIVGVTPRRYQLNITDR